MGPAFLRKYNTAITAGTIYSVKIPMIKRGVVDFALSADWTPAAGDVKVSKDGGVAANIATLPAAVAMGNTAYWEFVFSGAELSCGNLMVTVGDSATKAVEDQAFQIETFGNASAAYPVDWSDVVRMGLTAFPAVASGSAGAIPTTGAGANQISVASGQVILQAGTGTGQLDFTSGVVKSSLVQILGTALTETAGQIAAAFKQFFNVASPTGTLNDSTTLLGRLTAARAGYLDNANVGGPLASHADILAINQSASKHVLLTTVQQYCPGEGYTIECRTFAAADGSAVNADSTPTFTATGATSGSLSGNLGAVTNPATGVYRVTYTVSGSPTLEQIRLDVSATISAATFTLSTYAQTVDEATVVWTSTDQSHLTSIFNKLPTNNLADETIVLAAIGTPIQAGPVTVGTNNDKTGYALSAAGLDQIAITDPGAPAGWTTFPKMLLALCRRFLKKSTLTSTQLKTYADDGATVNSNQAVSDDGTTQTQGAAS